MVLRSGERQRCAMSRTQASAGTIGALHASGIAQRWSALRARVSFSRLDIELANGVDPWSSTELMLRAARIGSASERRKLATALVGLVEVARLQGSTCSAHVPLRRPLVLEHEEEIQLLANRLRELEPVDVATRAELALLLRDGRSPIYVGGRPPNEFIRVIARALHAADLA